MLLISIFMPLEEVARSYVVISYVEQRHESELEPTLASHLTYLGLYNGITLTSIPIKEPLTVALLFHYETA